MSVAVLVPYADGGCPYRARAWDWVRDRYQQAGYEIVTGTSSADGFSRTQAILDARSRTSADLLIVADADVWCEQLQDGLDAAAERGWAVPHWFIHRLSEASTVRVRHGEDWHGQPLCEDNLQDSKPHRGNEAGTLLVLTAAAFDTAPPDPRFIGWGSEDLAWAHALRCLVGDPWRGTADLVHLWHPAQPRRSRVTGNQANADLLVRYELARLAGPDAMRSLIEEART